MRAPIESGNSLSLSEWHDIRQQAIFRYCKWDTQCQDHPVLARFPLILRPDAAAFLDQKAEALSREAFAAEEEILERHDLVGRLRLPRGISRALRGAPPDSPAQRSLRVMRFDFHHTTEGWRISEVNSDVPGGFIEASGWNALFAQAVCGAAPACVSQKYADAIHSAAGSGASLALVHATAFGDDRQVMVHLARSFAQKGLRPFLASPSNLRWVGGRAEVRYGGNSVDVGALVRFFPAEWLPNLANPDSWKPYFRKTPVLQSNPGSAIVLQSKRFPLVWDELRAPLATWRELLPQAMDPERLGERDEMVLKPALGRVGEDVGLPGVTPPADYARILRAARRHPSEWIAQRRFFICPVETGDGPVFPCIGVFTIGGRAAGYYGRAARTPMINQDAQDAAVLVGQAPVRSVR